jgi:hypothetical protein
MSCAAHSHRFRTRARILCFECYRSRIDRPERVKVLASPFPRVLTSQELAHRRKMLTHFANFSRRSSERVR